MRDNLQLLLIVALALLLLILAAQEGERGFSEPLLLSTAREKVDFATQTPQGYTAGSEAQSRDQEDQEENFENLPALEWADVEKWYPFDAGALKERASGPDGYAGASGAQSATPRRRRMQIGRLLRQIFSNPTR